MKNNVLKLNGFAKLLRPISIVEALGFIVLFLFFSQKNVDLIRFTFYLASVLWYSYIRFSRFWDLPDLPERYSLVKA